MEDRGVFFIHGCLSGMIVEKITALKTWNSTSAKQLTNHRASGEELAQMQAPVEMSPERVSEYIGPDE